MNGATFPLPVDFDLRHFRNCPKQKEVSKVTFFGSFFKPKNISGKTFKSAQCR
jgi:hypothetical protein